MPIYEYECVKCGESLSRVVLPGRDESEELSCGVCGSRQLRRVMSSFAVVTSESSRLKDLDMSKPRDESFYRDPRNVGLWAKKRAQQLGVDLGPRFEETVEKARSGKLVKEMLDD